MSNSFLLTFGLLTLFFMFLSMWKIADYLLFTGKEAMYSNYRNTTDKGGKDFSRIYYAWLIFWAALFLITFTILLLLL